VHQAGVVPPRKVSTVSISGHLQVGHHQMAGHHQMKYIGLDHLHLQESPERAKAARAVARQARVVDMNIVLASRANRIAIEGLDIAQKM